MTRSDRRFARAKERTAAAARTDAAAQETLRAQMENGKKHAPARLTRRELDLARRMDDGSGGPVKPRRWFGR